MNPPTEGVIVLHGILRTRASMQGLAQFLKDQEFDVLNLNYASTHYPLEQLIDQIHPEINAFINTLSGLVHFVGYSMGGLLIRAYLKKYRPTRLGRIVLVATPNQGSELADYLSRFWLYKKIFGPAGQQLITNQSAFKDQFAEVDFESGMIAGNRPLSFITSYIIGKSNDGEVSVQSTQLEGAQDHIVLPYNHLFFPKKKKMWHQVCHFLQFGQFEHGL